MKRWLEYVLLIAGICLLLIYAGARLDSERHSRANITAFRSQWSVLPDIPNLRRRLKKDVKFDLWAPARIKGYESTLNLDLPPPLAILRIPKIDLEVPVLEGTDEIALNRGVGWIEGTARPGEVGNIGIAGHRDGFFRGLKDIHTGDRIELELSDDVETYVVNHIDIVSPQEKGPLTPSNSTSLTLVTCYPFYFIGDAPQRYIVKASLEIPNDWKNQSTTDPKQTNQNQENK